MAQTNRFKNYRQHPLARSKTKFFTLASAIESQMGEKIVVPEVDIIEKYKPEMFRFSRGLRK